MRLMSRLIPWHWPKTCFSDYDRKFSNAFEVSYHDSEITDGSLHTFGLNNYGQLGDGTTSNRTTSHPNSGFRSLSNCCRISPLLILRLTDPSILLEEITIMVRDGTTTQRTNSPTQILSSGVSQIASWYNSLILKTDGSLHTFGRNFFRTIGGRDHHIKKFPYPNSASGVSNLPRDIRHLHSHQTDG